MSRNYKRSASVIIGNTKSINIANALKITKLRIMFNIEKDNIGSPNNAKIYIYNLSEESRSKIETEFTKVVLNAGYENNEKLLFSGSIYFVFHNKVKENIITEIHAGDGQYDFKNSFFNKAYEDTIEYKEIVTDVAKTFEQVKIGNIDDLPSDKVALFGISYSDSSHVVLDEIARNTKTSWYIDNELLYIVANDSKNKDIETTFSSSNGMIDVPIVTENGINLQVLLRPNLNLSSNFKVDSANPNFKPANYYIFGKIKKTKGAGTFRIVKLIHLGDTHGQQWTTNIEGVFI